MRLLKFAILLCLSMMFATSYAQMAVKETDKRKTAIDVFDDKDFELAVGYNEYVVSQPGKDTGWASYSFCARGKIKELDCSLPLSLEAGLLMSYFNGDYNNEDNNRFGEYSMRMFSLGVPLNLVYEFPVSSDVSVAPYAGLSARLNVWAEMELRNGEKIDLFSNKYGANFETLQFGGQIGVSVAIERIVIRAEVHTDFSNLTEQTKLWGVGTSIGYRF